MLKKYNAIYGQSNFDVCLNTYGTLDQVVKLMLDSGVASLGTAPQSNQEFTYDDSLVQNEKVNQNFSLRGVRYATDIGILGSVYYIINQVKPPGYVPPAVIIPPPTPSPNMKEVAMTSYTSIADATMEIYPTDKDGHSMVGYDVIMLEKETKPLVNADWNWNRSLGKLTLLAAGLDSTQTLFILYAKLIS